MSNAHAQRLNVVLCVSLKQDARAESSEAGYTVAGVRATQMSDTAVKRLHITPLDAAILDTVLQPSIRHLATDISFHTIETYPENNYGFVTLPVVDADKVTKKLNGAILKGKKFRIEQAKPAPTSTTTAISQQRSVGSASRKHPDTLEKDIPLKRKATENTIEGYELPSPRKVMRGWTEPRASLGRSKKKDEDSKKSKKQPSKYSNGSECLFRTVPPANKSTKSSKKREGADSVTVHEFKKTIKHPSFVKSGENVAPSKLTGEYVEGKGWVDREGNVKEQPPKRSERPQAQSSTKSKEAVAVVKADKKTDTTVESPVASSESGSSEAASSSSDDWTSSEGSDESSEAEESDGESSGTGSSSSSAASDGEESEAVEQEPPAAPVEEVASAAQVHPLEALFKRPKSSGSSIPNPHLTIDTQFSFFGNAEDSGSDIEAHNEGYTEPQTPFTALDLQSRSMRSLAPTPDTALPTKITFWENDANEDYLRDDNDGLDVAAADKEHTLSPTKPGAKRGKDGADDSEFAQWFWENRGDNNRAWKRRRREAGKEKRQRDNKSHSSRGRR
ncbi:uncharacterized protein GIQ15_03560 [Arthroderma uncinatum]|uniref:uncharacterized protein n=1 Tax=Arthroderma uncinatum TaxID=74035 RepID=UPI00144A5CD4|nr:uncharacterized protein GIQ15_03560 [Arthroderma uncinatum]KAF3484236.1 hypothetical protein GIQ15_03560 [Arthroderma uncinatum]